MRNATAIILAAGKSMRMEGADKITQMIANKPLIYHALAPFLKSKHIRTIILVCSTKNKHICRTAFPKKNFPNIHIILGGKTRFQSAKNAFDFIQKNFRPAQKSIILYHNAANVLCTTQEIDAAIRTAKRYGACIVARPASDTLKEIKDNKIIATIDRKKILYAETPQAFQNKILKKAYRHSAETTDESSLVEAINQPIQWIPASMYNRKMTIRYDLEHVKNILEKTGTDSFTATRYGIAADAHIFEAPSRSRLKLCGIIVANTSKLFADSDGDVALHALAAAISQTIGGGSLGTFATAMCKKGIVDSKKYVKDMLEELTKKQLAIKHIGLHFECNRPHIDPLVPKLKKALSKLLHISSEEIGITASSGKLRISSEKDGIHCTAIVTVAQTSQIKT